MARKLETRVIDGIEFKVQQMTPTKAFPLMAKLGGIISPVLDKVIGIELDSDVGAMGPALGALFTNLDSAQIVPLSCEIFNGVVAIKDGKMRELNNQNAIDAVFEDSLGTWLKALKFSLEVNFGDFLSSALSGSASLSAETADLSS